MSNKAPLVSFIVLNWNGLEDTKKCIESIEKVRYPNKELIIVDNGSADGSKEYFRSLKDIIYVDLPENTGFSGGHIAGRNVSSGEYLAIVNNDLVLDENWVNACLETFKKHSDAALVGGKAYKWNEQNPAYNTENEFYSYQEVDPETGYTRTLLTGEEECSVDSISGAALLIKQASLEKVGYFDNTFFAYYEETDLIARLIRTGLKAYYNPAAHTWHKIAASSGENSELYLYLMHRNRYMFAVKNLDDKYLSRFIRSYRREVLSAYLRYFRNRNDIEAKCRIKASKWIRSHDAKIKTARTATQALGASYTDNLRSYNPQDVTIVIPCYNYGKYVGEAIDSVLNQTFSPKRIIVLNDGSTDNSMQVINGYKNNKLVEIIDKPNTGVIDTKNTGIKLSTTYWTVFLDADDRLSKTFLRDTLKMTKNGAKDIVYTDMRLFGTINDIFKAKAFSVHTLLKTNYINNSALIKTSLLKQTGGYKPEMKHRLEDWELYITLVEAGAKPQYLPIALVQYRQHEVLSRNNDDTVIKEKEIIQQIKNLHKSFYRKHGYFKTITFHGIKLLIYCVRYPGLLIVMLKAIPAGLKLALSHIYSKGLAYLQKKLGIID